LIFGSEFAIPGYLVWGALVYAIFGTALTQWIGSPLVRLDFQQQRFEADFRFNLVRVRENSEQIALLQGESAERQRLSERFGRVVENWYAIMSRTKRLTAFTRSYSQAAVIFPYILVAPAYFADKIQLGGMMQTASAFSSVQTALSFFVSIYRTLAEWRAVVARLDGFEMAIASAATLATGADSIDVVSKAGSDKIDLEQLLVRLPNGTPLVSTDSFSLLGNERTLVTGPSGAGKSTLFRAIAGVWPFGNGSIAIPANAKLMMLPQRPYFPVGSLQAAIVYPAEASAFSSDQVRDALISVGLPQLAPQLEEEAHWNRMLSLGEQQRLGLARALLHAPQYLFLDEATASRDEAAEAALYRLIEEKSGNHHRLDRPRGHAHLRHSPAAQADVAHLDQPLRRSHDAVRRRVRRSLPRAAYRPAMAGGVPRGARDRRTRSRAPRRPAPAPAGTSTADCLTPPAAG
jgi:putative ATP-binding cassette transporter